MATRRALSATLAGGVAGTLLLTSAVVANAAPLQGASAQHATEATQAAVTLSPATATLANAANQPAVLGAVAQSVIDSVAGGVAGGVAGAYAAAKFAAPAAAAAAEESSSSSSSSSSSGNAQTYYQSNAGDALDVQFNAPTN